ncbi:MAG: site-specific DNA-methyltransferase, partial [Clostridia bacterium]
GRVQCVYIDPPFNTGLTFCLRMRVGEQGWRSGKTTLALPAYEDRWPDDASFLSMMRQVLTLAHALLSEEGTLFLHIDARMHAQLRLMMDDVFGASNFMNEIIWAYQTGGRATSHFSRKHDIILFYRKSPAVYFALENIPLARGKHRTNHMRRSVDEQGRAYRSIRSAGKEYRYYDDDPVYPGDVWADVSHLQQKDPQRTGYDTQKPLKLLERIVLCATRPGDLVADLCAGSGTTAVAAALHGRTFLSVDKAACAVSVARKRLLPYRMTVEMAEMDEASAATAEASCQTGIGYHEVTLDAYTLEEDKDALALSGLDAVDQWSVGYLREGVFVSMADATREKKQPVLSERLDIPILSGTLAILILDIFGRRRIYTWPVS